MVYSSNLGFPRIGANREIKKAVESYWARTISQEELIAAAAKQRATNWALQSGLDFIPSNDFSLYDHILDAIVTVGAIPARYKPFQGTLNALDLYFAMARGSQVDGVDVKAMEMTKLFDTNYHYIVPEFEEGIEFKLSSTKIVDEFKEAKAAGIKTRPVIYGPASFLILGKPKTDSFDYQNALSRLVPIYIELLKQLAAEGAEWIQLDEPTLVLDLTEEQKGFFKTAYDAIKAAAVDIKVIVATYFESLRDNAEIAYTLPVNAVHIDLTRTSGRANADGNTVEYDIEQVIKYFKSNDKIISLGIVDGRNIWANDIASSVATVRKVVDAIGSDRVIVAGSSSLLHTPVDLASETQLDATIRSWLAFAVQKLGEIKTIAKGANEGTEAIAAEIARSKAIVEDRKTSTIIHNEAVQARLAAVKPADYTRPISYAERRKEQFKLPLLPTTSIGSFPQTAEIRSNRSQFKANKIDEATYVARIQEEIKKVIDYQVEEDFDVLVHGEAERNDMVEYFGEQLSGFSFTANGWVQSYGSRCVKPAIIYGDVARPNPMTVKWSAYAQTLTSKPVKAMLTGPVTILQWTFVRDDQPRAVTATQVAFAIRDEVNDLQNAGLQVIQIDEAALREGMPLRAADKEAYLKWAVDGFRLTAGVARNDVQIHTHMCYSDFNSIIHSINAMDADVISIETSRSDASLLKALSKYNYSNEIGPGVYDIHSPRVPTVQEMVDILERAAKVVPIERLWVNPDCGLKTRQWKEVIPALRNLVAAAKQVRAKYEQKQ